MSYQPISGVTLVCMSASAAISALSLFHGEEEEEWEDSNLSSLSLSPMAMLMCIHPAAGREGEGRACVRRGAAATLQKKVDR